MNANDVFPPLQPDENVQEDPSSPVLRSSIEISHHEKVVGKLPRTDNIEIPAPGLLRATESSYSLSAPSATREAEERVASRTRAPGYTSGSPVRRSVRPADQKVNQKDRRARRVGVVAVDKIEAEPKIAQPASSSAMGIPGGNIPSLRPRPSNLVRSDKFGFGPTMRQANDAREIIMGDGDEV